LLALLLLVGVSLRGHAQIPRINTFFPMGGKAGATVEVELRGASLEGANLLLVHGKGVNGTVLPGDAKVDETNKPVWQSRCGSCHELRSPANRSLTSAQWAATVERMVKVRQAPLSADETAKVTQYLQSASRAGKVTAQIKIDPDTLPGIYELRVATPRGVSSPYWFEVGNLPEVLSANGKREQAQPITLPCIANGCFQGNGEHHWFKFAAKKDQRLVFNLKGFRYNDTTQFYFNPNLRLYDAAGNELVENHGYYDFDPLIDWVCPTDGEYILEVRDLLSSSNPGSVYRLTMGVVPYDTVLYPPAAQANSSASLQVIGKNAGAVQASYTLAAPADTGVIQVGSPSGPMPCYVTPYPVVKDESLSAASPAVALPAGFGGRIGKAGATDTFPIKGDGMFTFETYASRLGAQTNPRVTLLNAKGGEVGHADGDSRMTAKLEAGQAYSLRVQELAGQGGPEYVYMVEARPAKPGLTCVARPDNVTLRPGVAVAVDVILTQREGVEGDVQITAEDLPPGVTMTPVVIPPDRNEAWLLLRAAPDCKPLEQPIHIIATAHGPLGDVKTLAQPQELYRLNGDLRAHNWSSSVVAVRGQADFQVQAVSSGPIKVHPRKAVPVKFKITRRPGFTGGVTVYLSGLPSGWVANPESTTGTEVTLMVRADGNDTNPYLKRDAKLSPILATIEAQSDEFRFAFGTLPCTKADKISDRDDDR
jgi:hypothetical protein